MSANEAKTKGMRVIPAGEKKCIWMDAGVVSYKLCTNQFQCNICDFDRALSNRAQDRKIETKENRTELTNKPKKEIVEWMEEFRHLPADQRKCRYMLTGDVSYKICPNSFLCGECTFDQMMQDRVQPSITEDSESFPMIAGFRLNENLFYFRNHTWLRLERNGQYRIGLDDFASIVLGEPRSIELSTIGKHLDVEELCWTFHHQYGDLEFLSPVKGVVSSINYELLEANELISNNPYSKGWLMTIDPENIAKSNRNFLTGEEAKAWMIDESNLLNKSISTEAGITMHDGAAYSKNFSQQLSKEKWQQIVKEHFYLK